MHVTLVIKAWRNKKSINLFTRSKTITIIHLRYKNLNYRYVTIKIHSTIRLLLKVCKFGISQSSHRRAFHNLGAATWKDLSPSVTLVLNVGDASNIPHDDLRLYVPCDFKETKFWMYAGATPWIVLNANNKILKWMRCFDGSQCSSYISGVDCYRLFTAKKGKTVIPSRTLQTKGDMCTLQKGKLCYLSNRTHFLWVYWRDNPRRKLEEHEKSL